MVIDSNDIINKCPECNNQIIFTSYQKVCSFCGLILDECNLVDTNYTLNKKNEEFTQARQYVSIGRIVDRVDTLGSYIDFYERSYAFRDINNKLLSLHKDSLYARLKQKYERFSKIRGNETNYRISLVCNDICRNLHLNYKMREQVMFTYYKIKKNKKIPNHVTLLALCFYEVIKKSPYPITLNQICEEFEKLGHRVTPRLIIGVAIRFRKKTVTPHKITEDYIYLVVSRLMENYSKFEERLKFKGCKYDKKTYTLRLTAMCFHFLSKFNINKRKGKNPYIFTGATIYVADKLLAKKENFKPVFTQKILSKYINIAEYSIRDHYTYIKLATGYNFKD